ncbi:MAG: hypothetical protein ACXQS8_01430 [Candidatus Helarchaeales archaeon]
MADDLIERGKKRVQKWQKKYPKKKHSDEVLIYPHYHCIYCNAMIELGEEHLETKIQDKSYPGIDHVCSKCVAKIQEKQEKKPWYKRFTSTKVVLISLAVVAVVITLVVIFWLNPFLPP